MLRGLSTSSHFEEHCHRILDSFAAPTIYRYLSTLQFHATCISLRVSLEGLKEIQFADILLAGRSSDPRVSPSMCIKSVRWAFKQFGIQCFQVALGPNFFFHQRTCGFRSQRSTSIQLAYNYSVGAQTPPEFIDSAGSVGSIDVVERDEIC